MGVCLLILYYTLSYNSVFADTVLLSIRESKQFISATKGGREFWKILKNPDNWG